MVGGPGCVQAAGFGLQAAAHTGPARRMAAGCDKDGQARTPQQPCLAAAPAASDLCSLCSPALHPRSLPPPPSCAPAAQPRFSPPSAGIVEQLAGAIEAEIQELGGDDLAEADVVATIKVEKVGGGQVDCLGLGVGVGIKLEHARACCAFEAEGFGIGGPTATAVESMHSTVCDHESCAPSAIGVQVHPPPACLPG